METSQVLAQHSAYISLGRGVRSHFTPATPTLRQISQQVSGNPRLNDTFSNTLQRHISHDMSSYVYESKENEDDGMSDELPALTTPPQINRLEMPSPPPNVPIQRERGYSDMVGVNENIYCISPWLPITPSHSISSQSTE
jgi:hypothetical protein